MARTLAKLLLIALITAALSEGLIRLMLGHPDLTPEPFKTLCMKYHLRHDRPLVQYLRQCAQWDPGLFYTLRPGSCEVASREFDVFLQVNALGLRDDEVAEPPRVVVLGDSQAMGWGVAQDQTFAQRLEAMLGEPVLNAAVPSYGTAREMLMLQRLEDRGLLDDAEPAAVVIAYNANDFDENLAFVQGGFVLDVSPQERWEELARQQDGNRAYWPGKHLWYMLAMAWDEFGPADSGQDQADPVPAPELGEAQAFMAVLDHFKDLLAGRTLVVLEINEHAKNNDGDFLGQVQALLAQGGEPEFAVDLRLADLSGALVDGDFYAYDGHMTAAGHARVAGILAELLK